MFCQVVVRQFKTSLSRQIAEAVRIQMRGTTLNSAGVYNRCKLTRLVVDREWDKEVWDENWQSREVVVTDDENIRQLDSKKRKGEVQRASKRRKVDDVSGSVWGEEQLCPGEENGLRFLQSGPILRKEATTGV